MKYLSSLFLFCSLIGSQVQAARWYRGNTHAHTKLAGNHGDRQTTPLGAAKWYHDRGYHFLSLSEHNRYIDPKKVGVPSDWRKDFILIPGEELTGKKAIHTGALNTAGKVDPAYISATGTAAEILQSHVQGVNEQAGHAIINHPNFKWALKPDDIKDIEGTNLFELYNGHPSVNNEGDKDHPSTEALWDILLSAGKKFYGVSSDDTHYYYKIDPEKLSNPGRGWVMVKAEELSPAAIGDAMARGEFYSSSGLMLSDCGVVDGVYHVSVDEAETARILKEPSTYGRRSKALNEGLPLDEFKIDFIGKDGRILQSTTGASASLKLPADELYVRAKVSFVRMKDSVTEAFFAWCQPAFKS